jgi:biopolymer transport protein TolR
MQTRFSAEPNVTPMIDVLLVLLIVFMVASVQRHHTIDAQLPVSSCDLCANRPQIVLEVLPGPSYRINRAPVASGDLLSNLYAIYESRPEKLIQVAGSPGVRYDDVIAAMDVAKSAGVRVISVAPKSR